MEALLNKQLFIGMEDNTWFYSGAETPPLKGSLEAVNDYMNLRSEGPGGRENNAAIEASCKSNLALLLGGKPENISLLSNSSEIISMIAGSLAFRPGDNVVVNRLEFPSGILPWLVLQDRGVEVRFVEHTNWQITPDNILECVDERTRLVMTSHVSYLSGTRLDYRGLYDRLKRTEALLLLDATQSLGAVPVDMNETDFLVCSSYKWLLGIHGLGILGINPERLADFMPRSVGWRSVVDMFSPIRHSSYEFHKNAQRFETGYPSYPTVYALNHSTKLLLDTGIDRIENHILRLGDELIGKLEGLGFEIMTPKDPLRRAGNICVISERGDEISELLQMQRIYLWGGDGRFRASIHLFNDSADVDRLIDCLSEGFVGQAKEVEKL
ncbi:aminotransferase class V-fold PLP-dependent enzyme [Paenibacillus sp. LHD-117]|uniref:aminotransferase class V-fold PLP-dependent enzyme n=1 Tax=Paenibacillus sp. LHD-117 TaxID=3071412 RepID=UPI0027DED9D8|nr:aminotransferase class V-fold PLP-dependent enzyme [Paenibacillus sp. LHD-117]MDQ6419716.1 aminotransferase class V-fold PLP-dependent enzyme [Paenibacillus sp. LHD-117]